MFVGIEINFEALKSHVTGKPTPPGDEEEYVALCFTAKNESLNLPELLLHHYHHIGIRRFYIMDDGSKPPLSSYDYPIPKEAITFVFYSEKNHKEHDNQLFLNSECQRLFGNKHTWIGYFDCDEYLEVIRPEETLVGILKEMELENWIGALAVNWKIHTSAGLKNRAASIRAAFNMCIWDDPDHQGKGSKNNLVKSFVRTDFWGPNINPHVFRTTNGTITVGEHGKPWQWVSPHAVRMPITRDRLALHHYMVKSREEYEEKMERSKKIEAGKIRWSFFKWVESLPKVSCPEMAAYHP
jgi:hypothetical protein